MANEWKNVLFEIYRLSPTIFFENHQINFYNDHHALAKELKISGSDLGDSIGFLKKMRLISEINPFNPLNDPNINPEWQNDLHLSEKGFNVAFELDKQFREVGEKKRFEKLQKWMILLTALLVGSSFLNIFFYFIFFY